MEVINLFYRTMRFIALLLFRIFFRINIHGKENEPSVGKTIICSNHANNLDPIFVSMAINRQVHWMAKKELFKNKMVSWFIKKLGAFPINRGETDIKAIKTSIRILKDENILGIFPEGTRMKSMDLKSVKAGTGLLAVKSKATILPVYIKSKYNIFSKVDIYIGQPLDISKYYNGKLSSKDYEEVSKIILSNIYSLNNMEELN
jgi:1-acyl-sn-glycerol-3-phosphate acyltransferase